MKKERQKLINEACVNFYEWAVDLIATNDPVFIKRLNYCKAYVYAFENEYGTLDYILRSYDTIVACCSGKAAIDFSRYAYGYTATTCQHIRKFFNQYASANCKIRTWRDV